MIKNSKVRNLQSFKNQISIYLERIFETFPFGRVGSVRGVLYCEEPGSYQKEGAHKAGAWECQLNNTVP